MIISSEEKIRKPARDLYMLALDREFVTAKHALMVGNDERNDIIGANSAGLDAAYFRTEISPADDPDVSAHAVCSFTGADYDGLLKFVLDAWQGARWALSLNRMGRAGSRCGVRESRKEKSQVVKGIRA